MFTPPNMSRVTCHVSRRVSCHMSRRVTCHVSHVTCNFFFCCFWTKWWSLSVQGLLSTGPTPSSCRIATATPGLLHTFIYMCAGSSTHYVCSPYRGRHWCATALHPDGTYSSWAYCHDTLCPNEGQGGSKGEKKIWYSNWMKLKPFISPGNDFLNL